MNYKAAVLKNKLELFLIWPIVFFGKIAGYLFPLKSKNSTFLFFSSADIGGSIKVNADILNCIKHKKPVIIFSKKPKNNQFLHFFEIEGITILDLSKYIDNKWLHFLNLFFRGLISTWINNANTPIVFGGECIYFYKMVPYLKKSTKTLELCHLNTWFNFSQAYIRFIDYRIFSTKKIKRDVEAQYLVNAVPVKYNTQLHFIDNKIIIPPLKIIENDGLKILYVGRGAPQKRVHLIAAIAKNLEQNSQKFHFTFVGDVDTIIDVNLHINCTLLGNINNEKKLHQLYAAADVLILTSAYEGLPLVVMEMMARGKVVLSTAVDSIPDYITHLQNGLLLFEQGELEIVDEAVSLLQLLESDKLLLKALGEKSYQFAIKNFSEANFNQFYKNLFL